MVGPSMFGDRPVPTKKADRLPADVVERIARDQAKADQLNWDEPCLQDADNDIYCESSTCMAAFYEDHDADAVRQHYLSRARTAWATVQAYLASDMVVQADRDLFAHILLTMNGNEWVSEGVLKDAPDNHPAFTFIIAHRRAAVLATQPTDPRDAEIERLKAERDRPETKDWLQGVMLEAAHQRARWGAAHDAGKTPLDWFWLLGFLGQKAADAAMRGDTEKALHHTISTAAALANWHLAIIGADNQMRPGIDGEQA